MAAFNLLPLQLIRPHTHTHARHIIKLRVRVVSTVQRILFTHRTDCTLCACLIAPAIERVPCPIHRPCRRCEPINLNTFSFVCSTINWRLPDCSELKIKRIKCSCSCSQQRQYIALRAHYTHTHTHTITLTVTAFNRVDLFVSRKKDSWKMFRCQVTIIIIIIDGIFISVESLKFIAKLEQG